MLTLAAAAFVLCAGVIAIVRPLARRVGLLDVPGGRKMHEGSVPLVGGIGMLVAIAVGMWLMPAADPVSGSLLGAFALLVAVGVADDRFDVPARGRLVAHMLAALIALIVLDADRMLSLGLAFGTAQPLVFTGLAAVAVSLLLVAGAINAFNMIDGTDGLAGAMALIALSGLGWLAAAGGDTFAAQLCAVTVGAVGGFLLFNLPLGVNRRWRVFMGDAGSTLLGFLAAIVALRLTQTGASSVAPVTVLWLAAIPIADLLVVMLRRMLSGRSPFRADRQHIHHQLLDAGLAAPAVLLVLTAAAATLALAGLWMHSARIPEVLQLVAFLGVAASLGFATSKAQHWVVVLPAQWKRAHTGRSHPESGLHGGEVPGLRGK